MNDPIPAAGFLLRGVEEAVNAAFRVKDFSTKTAYLSLKLLPRLTECAEAAARAILGAIETNFPLVIEHPQRVRSKENWRTDRPNVSLAQVNADPEIILERSFIRACKTAGRTDWWNQVPVSSGLEGRFTGKGRAMDLVRRRSVQAYDFVELKVESNNPLYATVEILQYGFIWLVSRVPEHRRMLGQEHPSLLDATDIALCVLAPEKFYAKENVRALEVGINNALDEISHQRGVKMIFRFEQFQCDIDAQEIRSCDDRKLLGLFDGRLSRCR